MAIFGAPVAHGDDAERAVRAGLGMQARDGRGQRAAAPRSMASRFELCVGINTGEVLAGQVGDSYTVIGDTVNVAARLQAAARPGSVTVGEATYRATREAIDFTAAGGAAAAQGQGRAGPRLGGARRRREAAGGAARRAPCSAPLVGRAAELAQLRDLLGAGAATGAARTWRRSSAIPVSASRGCCGSSRRSCRARRPSR